MIIEVEDRFCKVAQVFSQMLTKVEHAAARGRRCMRSRSPPSASCWRWVGRRSARSLSGSGKTFLGRRRSSTTERRFGGYGSNARGRICRRSGRRRFAATSTPRGKRNVRRWCRWMRSSACPRGTRPTCCRSGAARSAQRVVQGVAGLAAGDPRFRAVGQLPGGYGEPGREAKFWEYLPCGTHVVATRITSARAAI